MKIAYTINGILGGLTGKNYENDNSNLTVEIARCVYKSLYERILKHNDVDIFLFSWHKDEKDILDEIYKPKKSLHIEQILFTDLPKQLTVGNQDRVQAHISKWYGFKEVMRLRREYEKENNIKYDLVANCRFDHFWEKDIYFSDLNPEKIHTSKWTCEPEWGWPTGSNPELLGDIFVMKPEYMDQFATMFDHITEYIEPGQCPQWNTISHHFLNVWHLRKLGLLDENLIKFPFVTCFSSMMKYHKRNGPYHRDNLKPTYMIFRWKFDKMESQNLNKDDIFWTRDKMLKYIEND